MLNELFFLLFLSLPIGVNANKKVVAVASEIIGASSNNDLLKNVIINKPKADLKSLPFDRSLIATKLAASLVMQRREDVSIEDMDSLIHLFLLMVKLSKQKREIDGKNLFTKDLLAELGIIPETPAAVTQLSSSLTNFDDMLEDDVTALVQEVEEEISNDISEKGSKNEQNFMLESLTDSDLQTLLQNFKHLSTEEQHHLIAHLKKLESTDPERVEKLRKYVNQDDISDNTNAGTSSGSGSGSGSGAISTNNKIDQQQHHHLHHSHAHSHVLRESSRSRQSYNDNSPHIHNDNAQDDVDRQRKINNNSGNNNNNPNKFVLDDEDDDDYNFEDVVKAASKNVYNKLLDANSQDRSYKNQDGKSIETPINSNKNAENSNDPIVPLSSSPNALTFNPAGLNITLSDTQNLIANLMGSLQKSNANKSANVNKNDATIPTIGVQQQQQQQQQQQLQKKQMQQQQQQVQRQQQQSVPHNPQMNIPYYNQAPQQHHAQQQHAMGSNYNQMSNMGAPAGQSYYNNQMGGYNHAPNTAYPGYQQQWPPSGQAPPPNMQQYGMQHYMQGPPQAPMGYNMYGRGN